jgi:hypothetical protein
MVDPGWATRTLDGGRLTIPSAIAGTLAWLEGGSALKGWLVAIESERYRLLSDDEASRSGIVRSLSKAKEGDDIPGTPDPAEHLTPPLAVAGSRLVRVTIHPPPPGWRISLAGLPSTSSFNTTTGPVMLVCSGGHLEIWSLRLFQEARNTPLSNILELIG